jgi:hypothetical protein
MLPLENQQHTTTVIPQFTEIPSFPVHIIMALLMQPKLKILNAYLKLRVKNSVETKFSNLEAGRRKTDKVAIIYMGFCPRPQTMQVTWR